MDVKPRMDDKDMERLLSRLQEAVWVDFPQCVLNEDDVYEIQDFALTHSGTLEEIARGHTRVQLKIKGLRVKEKDMSESNDTESPEPITIKFRCDECGNMMELHLNPESKNEEEESE